MSHEDMKAMGFVSDDDVAAMDVFVSKGFVKSGIPMLDGSHA